MMCDGVAMTLTSCPQHVWIKFRHKQQQLVLTHRVLHTVLTMYFEAYIVLYHNNILSSHSSQSRLDIQFIGVIQFLFHMFVNLWKEMGLLANKLVPKKTLLFIITIYIYIHIYIYIYIYIYIHNHIDIYIYAYHVTFSKYFPLPVRARTHMSSCIRFTSPVMSPSLLH